MFNDELEYHSKENKLKWIDDEGNTLEEWPAYSGEIGRSVEDEHIPDKGPIPKGVYTIDPDKSNYDAWYKRDWGDPDAWGNVRTPIEPNQDTNTYGRGGMYIHGGKYPGSAGCIDLVGENNNFHNMLKVYGQPILLNVY